MSLAAGTGMDTLVRIYGEKLSQALGQPVVIENKPGGAGVVAGETIAKGTPDGYTLAVATSAVMAIRPTLFKVRPFDPLTDFVPISNYVKSPFVLMVNPSLPARTAREFVTYVKQKPGAELQLVRHRRRAAPDDGAAQAEVRVRHCARALPQQPAVDRRRRRRPRRRRSPRRVPRCR